MRGYNRFDDCAMSRLGWLEGQGLLGCKVNASFKGVLG
jgi:hypothetical protein